MDGCPGGPAGGGLAGQQGRRVVFRLNVPAQAFHDVLANGQPQSRASPSPVFFHLMESFKNAGQIAFGDAWAKILDGHAYHAFLHFAADQDGGARLGIAASVFQ